MKVIIVQPFEKRLANDCFFALINWMVLMDIRCVSGSPFQAGRRKGLMFEAKAHETTATVRRKTLVKKFTFTLTRVCRLANSQLPPSQSWRCIFCLR